MHALRRVLVVGSLLALTTSQYGCAGCSSGDDDDDGSTPPPLVLSSIVPASGLVGTSVVLTGTGFGDTAAGNQVLFGAAPATVTSWADTSIQAVVPAAAPAGPVNVTVAVGGTTSNAVPFEVLLPRAVYVYLDTAAGTNGVEGFAVATDGSLTPLAGSPYLIGIGSSDFGGDSDSVQVHLPTKRVFASHDQGAAVWNIDPATGALTEAAGFPFLVTTTGDFYGLDVSDAGDFLFLPDYANPFVHVLAVAADGSLSSIAGSPFASPSDSMDIPKVSGERLYVNTETVPSVIVAYTIATNGTLTELADSPFVMTGEGYGLETHPTGKFLFHANFSDSVVTELGVNLGSGALTIDDTTAMTSPAGMALTADGRRLFAIEAPVADPGLHIFDVSNGNGTLTPIPGSPFTLTGFTGGAIDVDDSGTYIFLADPDVPNLYVFVMNSADTPVPAPGSPFALSVGGVSGIEASF